MKRKIYLMIIFLSIISLQTFSQANSILKIDVGGQSTLISAPNNFIEVSAEKRKLVNNLLKENEKLLVLFLPADISPKLGVEPIKITKAIYVAVMNKFEKIKCLENDFIDFKGGFMSSYSDNLLAITKTESQLYSKLKNTLGNVENDEEIELGTIMDIKDAFATMILRQSNTNGGLEKTLASCLFIRLKNRILLIFISDSYKNEESLIWIYNTTQIWSKYLLDLNK
jgi:hypothetical protein